MVAAVLAGSTPTSAGWAVPVGCPVVDVDGAKVGTLLGADGDDLVVEHAFFWRYLVPLCAVGAFDGKALRPRVTKEAVRRGEWDATPPSPTARHPGA